MLNIALAEAGLETVPTNLSNHPSVRKQAVRERLEASKLILDVSLHYRAMQKIKDTWKRGRPDIVHVTLLAAMATPLYENNLLRVYVHTTADRIIEVGERVRLPKSFLRFEGLIRQLFANGEISFNGKILLKLRKGNFGDLVALVKPDRTVGLSRLGRMTHLESLAHSLLDRKNPLVVVGGFPRGHFSEGTLGYFDHVFAIHPSSLEAHTVVSRFLYEYEKKAMAK